MKRMIAFVLCLIVLLVSATASAAPQFNKKLIASAKTALKALAAGNYGKVSKVLPFSDDAPGADEWKSFACGSFSDIDAPQTKYAVAYWNGSRWRIAVPLKKPVSASVEVFVLNSADGATISGYGSADWGDIAGECRGADYVIWQDEYRDIDSAIVEFDN